MAEPRVLYLTGWLRSGSTMLGNVLGELPGVLHVGELHYLWRNGVLTDGTNSSCGCGRTLTDCDLWASALGGGHHTAVRVDSARRTLRLQGSLLRTRHTPARLREVRRGVRNPEVDEVVGQTADIYRLLADRGGERLIIDGSKYPAEAATLLGRSDLDVRVLHIVRDPRPTAFSFLKAKEYIDPMSPARSSGFWTAFNLASELVGRQAGERYLRVRHEDLCARPQETIDEVMRFAGLAGPSPVDAAGRVVLHPNHTVTGNPDRLVSGATVIRGDDRWRTGMTPAQIAVATAPALPLLARYGYPLVPRTEG
ncbi:sulfotransferase [Micromonospora sp. NPDC048871]|uniref:sulfotransferase n=1 Tax=unclassified Micromonospora TaxID=2617518 RepID=UPI002E120733|nr:sulfotransferase [Micromonospora sp. NBC_01739]